MPVINVKTWAGVSLEKKRDLVEAMTREAVRILDCKPEVVTVLIEEIPKENWGAAGQLCSERFPDK